MLSFRRQRTQRERERRTRHALEDAKRLDDNANKTMTTLINRRRERRASNERCASTPKKGVTVTRQSRRESHRRRHDDDDVTMIATIAIGTAMGAELDALNATINKKATAWQWASTESAAMTTLRRVQQALTRRKSWSQTTSSLQATSRVQTTRQGQQQPCPRDGPARQAGEEEATSVAPPRRKHRTNVIESDDDVDGDDVDDDAPPAEMCEYSMGNNGFDSSPGLRLTGHAASRAGSDKKL